MDAQGRGRADDIDPADQWVLNPNTGDYELRLQPSAQQSTVPRPRRTTTVNRSVGTTVPPRTDPGMLPGPRRRRPEEEPPCRRRTRPKGSKGKKVLLWTGGTMAFVLVAGAGGAYLYYQHLNGNIATTDVAGAGSSTFSKDEAFNILLIGTDKRSGKGNESYGNRDNTAGHADTTLLLHVAKDRSNATIMSIPRDLITDIPDCPTKQPDGSIKTVPGTQLTRFNNSFGQEGRDAGCTMRTVQQMTGIKVDHFMMADFNAVKTLTTAVDGVDVCVENAVNDKESKLRLPAGTSRVEGEQALAFVRTRHSFGNQGDLDRIKVQQQFLGSLIRKMKSELSNPSRLLSLAEAATKALTVDTGIGSINKLKDVALELKEVPPKNITFTTIPVLDNPAEKVKATVVLNESAAPQLFSQIKDDVSLTAVKQQASAEKAEVAARLKGSRSAASDIRVDIYNGGAPGGSAQETLSFLQVQQGVTKSSQLGNAGRTLEKTTLEYSPDQASQARKLADIMGLPASALQPGRSEENAQGLPAMILTLGEDYKGAGVSLTAPAKAPEGSTTANKKVCAVSSK